eukprot:Tamp_26263.p3 GENE.Tamp_26263~~Tamp_26263.p3  ORF type:complete len:176 (-),score=17.61 Tamp_26263:49-576(-)
MAGHNALAVPALAVVEAGAAVGIGAASAKAHAAREILDALANLLVGQLGDVLGKLRHGPKVSCVLQRRGSPAAGADTQAPRSRRGTPDPWAPRAPRPARRGPLRGLHERLAPRAALAHAPRRPGSSAPSQFEDPSLHSGRGRQRARAKPAHEKRKVAGGAKGPAEDNTPIDRLGV